MWAEAFVFDGPPVPLPSPHTPEEAEAWGRGAPEPPPPDPAGPRVCLWSCVWPVWVDVVFLSSMATYFLVGWLVGPSAPDTALALLPTCPRPADPSPLCYDWERPAKKPSPPASGSIRDGSSGSGGWSGDNDDDMAAIECFYGLVCDATRICFGGCRHGGKAPGWQSPAAMAPPGSGAWSGGGSDMVAMECFYGLLRDATVECFGCSYGSTIRRAAGYGDDPPPT
ncbi:hypothetical protein BS78_08G161400 [Paspalum vaginatum]|nr:hypothetical protein BS78_08G161400 [Paspalum vaginatum]